MIRYQVMTESALRTFASFEQDIQQRMLRVCGLLAENPTTRVPGCLEDQSFPEGRSVVVDNFNVVFEIDHAARSVIVIDCALFPEP